MNEFDYMNDIKTDFSQYEEMQLTQEELINMKRELKKRIITKKRGFKMFFAAAAVIAVISQTAIAQNIAGSIIKSISTGNNTFFQMEKEQRPEAYPIPDELQGQIYDKDGNVIYEFRDADEAIYNKDGKEVKICSKVNAGEEPVYSIEEVIPDDVIPESNDTQQIYTDIEVMKKDLNFSPLLPQAIPEGYSFLYSQAFKDENKEVSGDYANFYYIRGKDSFIVFERIINEETAFETGTDGKLEETLIHGNKAVYMEDMISWEENGISVTIVRLGAFTKDEIINLADSFK